jgi:hypothetical protein
MLILRSNKPVVVEIDPDEMRHIHFALYLMKDWLKKTRDLDKKKRRTRLREVNRLITLVDLLM